MDISTLPGTPRHQTLLAAITAFYAYDPRVAALAVFGSMARGNWTPLSDLDLDVVLEDGVNIEIGAELEALCRGLNGLGGETALIVTRPPDAGDVVLADLSEFSIRYHPLADTSPNIVSALRVLTGRLTLAEIQAAGQANRRENTESAAQLINACLRYLLGIDISLRRGQRWLALDLLHRVRGMVMQLYALAHPELEARNAFNHAPEALQQQVALTLPGYDLDSLRSAHAHMLDLFDRHWPLVSDGRFALDAAQNQILTTIREGTKSW